MEPVKRKSPLLRGLARTTLEISGVLLLAAPFFWLTARNYLHLDLWFDELWSLEKYILVSFTRTVTDYSSTNNHVFFSILTRKALRILGRTRSRSTCIPSARSWPARASF